MSDLFQSIVWYLVSGALGWAFGMVTNYRRAQIAGVSVVVPFISRSSRNFTIMIVVLSAITMFSVVSGQIQRKHMDDCTAQFQAVIRYNADLNRQDRELERRDDKLREERDDLLDELVTGLTLPDNQGNALLLLRTYQERVDRNSDDRAKLDAERAEVQKEREQNPYPEPKCD